MNVKEAILNYQVEYSMNKKNQLIMMTRVLNS